MRPASSRPTHEVSTKAKGKAKRDAQQRIVEMVVSDERINLAIKHERGQPEELLSGNE